MKKTIEVIGGVLIAAAAVLLVIQVFTGSFEGSLKEGAAPTEKNAVLPQDEYEKAVLADPVFTYTGTSAKKAGESCRVFEEVLVSDSSDGYEKTLKEAVAEGRIIVKSMEVLKKGDSKMEMAEADTDLNAGTLSIEKSGVYQVKINGMDAHNNPVRTQFLIAVNREGV